MTLFLHKIGRRFMCGWVRRETGGTRPDAEIATLRAYLRQREGLVKYAAAHIQHYVALGRSFLSIPKKTSGRLSASHLR